MSEKKFRKGDRVRFEIGMRFVEGVVKEDRGPIGIKGRHLYLIEFRLGPYAETVSEIELPAVDLELVPEAATKK
jgi:hypothetical protein